MRPAQQGAYDGLCGIYAIINALELTGLKGSRRGLHKRMFVQLTNSLTARELRLAMNGGLNERQVVKAAQAGFRWLAQEYGFPLTATLPYRNVQFADLTEYLAALQLETSAMNAAAIISFKGLGLCHWTVVRTVRREKLYLRDSFGLSDLDTSEFQLSEGPRIIHAEDTILIQLCDEASSPPDCDSLAP